jgi:hypothetical protein
MQGLIEKLTEQVCSHKVSRPKRGAAAAAGCEGPALPGGTQPRQLGRRCTCTGGRGCGCLSTAHLPMPAALAHVPKPHTYLARLHGTLWEGPFAGLRGHSPARTSHGTPHLCGADRPLGYGARSPQDLLYIYVPFCYICICICICLYVYVYVYIYMYVCICICYCARRRTWPRTERRTTARPRSSTTRSRRS